MKPLGQMSSKGVMVTDTLEDLGAPPYRSGDSNKVNRNFPDAAEIALVNDVCQMLHDMISVPSVISDHAKMIIARVRRG